MLKKIIVGLLVLTVIGGAAFALLDQQSAAATSTPVTTTTHEPQGGQGGQGNQGGQGGQPEGTQQVNASASSVGDVWSGSGTILELTSVGMQLDVYKRQRTVCLFVYS